MEGKHKPATAEVWSRDVVKYIILPCISVIQGRTFSHRSKMAHNVILYRMLSYQVYAELPLALHLQENISQWNGFVATHGLSE